MAGPDEAPGVTDGVADLDRALLLPDVAGVDGAGVGDLTATMPVEDEPPVAPVGIGDTDLDRDLALVTPSLKRCLARVISAWLNRCIVSAIPGASSRARLLTSLAAACARALLAGLFAPPATATGCPPAR